METSLSPLATRNGSCNRHWATTPRWCIWTYLTNFTGDGSYWQAPPPLPLVPQRFFRVSNP
jgi:hypothetical protein